MKFRAFFLVIFYLILPIISIFVFINFFASIFLRAEADASLFERSDEPGFFNPYPPKKAKPHWKKIGLHIHSDEVWFTPERDNVLDIYAAHMQNGFDWISISDYNLITDIRSITSNTFDSYEFGNNFWKKHFLVIGTKTVDVDPFYLYSNRANLQWILKQLNKRKAFIVVNHPHLNDTFNPDLLESLYGYHAIEIFTPFGDDTEQWDEILRRGIPILGISSEDFHFLPVWYLQNSKITIYKQFWKRLFGIAEWDGEIFRRFILMDFDETEKGLYRSLCKGSYLLANKFDGQYPELQIDSISFYENEEVFRIEFPYPVKEIRFFTNQSKNPVSLLKDVRKGSYKLQKEDTYVRLEVIDLNGILASNPVFRKNKFRKMPVCIE